MAEPGTGRDGTMKPLNAVVLAAALFLISTPAAGHPAALRLAPTPASAHTTAPHVSETAAAAPEQGRRRRPGRQNPRREQPVAAEAQRPEPRPAEAAPPRPAPPPGLCDVRWHESPRGAGDVTR